MSDVRSLLSPLFPGETFADTDQAYVERTTVPVGPEGGQARTAVEDIWPGVTFADTDVLVVETGRANMSDVVVLPGDLTTDDFNGAAGASPDSNIWVAQSVVTLDGSGHAAFQGSQSASLKLIAQPAFQGQVMEVDWFHFGNPTSGYNTTGTMQITRAADSNHYIRMSAAAGTFSLTTYAFSATTTTAGFNPSTDKFWRIRSTDQLYFETSTDGTTWTTRSTRAVLGWAAEACVYTFGSGPWSASGDSSDGSLAERFSLTASS